MKMFLVDMALQLGRVRRDCGATPPTTIDVLNVSMDNFHVLLQLRIIGKRLLAAMPEADVGIREGLLRVMAMPEMVCELLHIHLLLTVRPAAHETRLGLDMVVKYMLAESILGWRSDGTLLIGK